MPDDWRSLYPFESHWLSLDGPRYHYVDEGDGEPILLVHGNPTWSFYWRNLILPLRDRYRLVAPDHIGCGLSDKPQDYPYRLAQHIDNLKRLITELNLRNITLVVHDWGGAIGLGAAVDLPDRIARILILNTAAFRCPTMPLRIRVCRTPLLGPLAVRGLNAFARAALWMATERPERFTPAVKAGLLAPYDSWAHRVAIQRFVEDIPMNSTHPSYARLVTIEEGLPSLAEKPIAIAWGLRDWCFTPPMLGHFQSIYTRAEVHRFEDAGHYVVEDAHEHLVPIIASFMARHPLAAAPCASGTP